MTKGKIKLLWERMELDVKPLLDEQIYGGANGFAG